MKKVLLAALAALAALLATGVPTAALAADPVAAAQAAFDEGRRLEDAGDFAGAAARFEESERLDPALGTLLNLANCYERAGKLASAFRMFTRGAEEATALGEARRAQRAKNRAEGLRGRLSTIVIKVSEPVAPGEVVHLDGAVLDPVQWGVARPIDGGPHTVTVEAPQRTPFSTQFQAANEAEHAVIAVPELAPVAFAPNAVAELPSQEPKPAPSPGQPTPAPPPPHDGAPAVAQNWWTPLRVGAVSVAGAGLVLLSVGIVYGLQARDRWNERQNDCAYNMCNDRGYALTSQARDAANVATWAFVLGGAVFASGATMFVLAPRSPKETSIAAELSPAGPSLLLRGSF